jgi:hypothetical protein
LLVLAGAVEWLFSRRVYLQHSRPYAHGADLHPCAIVTVAAVTVIAAGASVALALGT